MSKNKAVEQKRECQPKRSAKQSARGNLYQKQNPEWARDRMRRIRATRGRNDGLYAQMISERRNPIDIYSDNILVTSDWHVPFVFDEMVELLDAVRKEHNVQDIVVAGDYWDCDNYTLFTRKTVVVTFNEEVERIAFYLKWLKRRFKRIWFCRGDHENRWMNMNGWRGDMRKLFVQTEVLNGYEVTNDDHVYIYQDDQKWLVAHPRNHRIIPLSVVRDLAAIKNCNVIAGHSHHFGQGWDRSGKYRIADCGGLFDKYALDYLCETTCHPHTRNGFYLLQDNDLIPFEPLGGAGNE